MAAKDAPLVEGEVDATASAGGIDQASARRLEGVASCEGILLGINVGPSCWPDGTLWGGIDAVGGASAGRRDCVSLGARFARGAV